MADRSFFVKLNLDDMAASLDALDSTEERGQWLEGFRVGSRGSKPREGWPEAKMLGHEFGMECWVRAEEYREKQAEKGRASGESRRKRTGSEPETNHGSATVQPQLNQPPNREATNQKPEAINHKPITENEKPTPQPPKGAKRASAPRFVPPSEDEWVAYCVATWPDWNQICAAESWAYYVAKGWRIGTSPCRDWKATARTSHGKAIQWGTLQPQQTARPFQGRSAHAGIRAATDQALIDQLEDQRNANNQSRTEPTASDTRWFDDAAASQATGA